MCEKTCFLYFESLCLSNLENRKILVLLEYFILNSINNFINQKLKKFILIIYNGLLFFVNLKQNKVLKYFVYLTT